MPHTAPRSHLISPLKLRSRSVALIPAPYARWGASAVDRAVSDAARREVGSSGRFGTAYNRGLLAEEPAGGAGAESEGRLARASAPSVSPLDASRCGTCSWSPTIGARVVEAAGKMADALRTDEIDERRELTDGVRRTLQLLVTGDVRLTFAHGEVCAVVGRECAQDSSARVSTSALSLSAPICASCGSSSCVVVACDSRTEGPALLLALSTRTGGSGSREVCHCGGALAQDTESHCRQARSRSDR